jgi:hypothetical protein
MNVTSEKRSCGLATWSLVLGIFALVLCPIGLLFAIPAVICGHKAMGRIKLSGGTMQGGGMAITGLVMGYVAVALSMVMVLLSIIAIPNFIKARNAALQNGCINNLRVIDAAKQQWALENAKKADAVPTEDEILPYVGHEGTMPVCGAGGTYSIHSVGESPTCSMPGHMLSH